MILDVGCGHSPQGDINVDLFRDATCHRSLDQRAINDKPLNPKLIPNLIIASAEYLPFKKNVFETVISRHVIEHVEDPVKMFKELIRVSKNKVVLTCPHRYGDNARIKIMHKHHFNTSYFEALCKQFNLIHIITLKHKIFPHKYFSFLTLFPEEIKIEIKKSSF